MSMYPPQPVRYSRSDGDSGGGFVLGVLLTLGAQWAYGKFTEPEMDVPRPIGSAVDYYLVKANHGHDRIAVVYGMADDKSYCYELAEMHMKRYPLDSYTCEAAQKD